MKFSRRQFNIFSGLSLISLGTSKKAYCESLNDDGEIHPENLFNVSGLSEGAPPLSILQGATDDSATTISILKEKAHEYEFLYSELGHSKLVTPTQVEYFDIPFTSYQIVNCWISDLETNKIYRFVVKSSDGEVIDEREFANYDIAASRQRFAIGSCMLDHKHRHWIWDSLEAQKPAALFLLGDQVYADKPTILGRHITDEEKLWNRYMEARLKLQLYRMRKLVPVFAVWDDHDTGLNNSNRTYKLIPLAQRVFDVFFPQDQRVVCCERGPGNAKLVRTKNHDFYLLDGRTFRSEVDANDETLLGGAQEDWLFQNLQPDKTSWLFCGTQWTPNYTRSESYLRSHPQSQAQFMKRLSETKAKVIFGSGDVHFSEVSRVPKDVLGYETVELTASCFHSNQIPGMDKLFRNKNRIASRTNFNYLMVSSKSHGTRTSVLVECFSKDANKPLFAHDFEIEVE